MEIHETKSTVEKVLLLSVDTSEYDNEMSVEELRELVRTAGGEVEGVIIQKLDKINPVSYIGSGKLGEAELFCHNREIDLVVCDDTLTTTQQRALTKALGVRVIDRTVLILDIFASGAKTHEGKLQVELAQLNYSLANLAGRGEEFSRLGGGIGTRGPGETKLETDRRHIRRRKNALEEQLKSLEKRRGNQRQRRKKDGVVTCAIVGYTNAGKSTLLNTLTNAGVLAEDKLFATLDPTSRALKLPDGRSVMLIDTVGFISRLPHLLIEAFKSTLEEAVEADILLLLADASDPEAEAKLETSKELLKELGAEHKPLITVYNKCDIAENSYLMPVSKNTVKISALTGVGLPALLDAISENYPEQTAVFRAALPYTESALLSWLHENARIIEEKYAEAGVFVKAEVGKNSLYKFIPYITEEEA
ncbi:MAG: GTPase HflX [Clostridia bacterium]|nr:GTPase HflX [Clostridia bacterium]